jgi:hypothetical protein
MINHFYKCKLSVSVLQISRTTQTSTDCTTWRDPFARDKQIVRAEDANGAEWSEQNPDLIGLDGARRSCENAGGDGSEGSEQERPTRRRSPSRAVLPSKPGAGPDG